MFSISDTIVAISTPPGHGGIGIVRLAGPAAPAIACRLIGRHEPLRPRHATFATVRRPSSNIDHPPRTIDQVVVTWFAAPQSFTGDDVVELSGHGSPVLLRQLVELAVAEGARLAEPGEFTFRAYLHGRMDLVQAEAVADLINAVTPLQARAAMDQLEGTLTGAIGAVHERLFDLVAKLEASLDFPDEGFHFVTPAEVAESLVDVRHSIRRLVTEGAAGRVVREGRLVALVGPPNSGKSSLFNALVGSSRAIVTSVAGTTRDILTETVDLDGLAITLVDTAGLRDTADPIEREGVRRARMAAEVASLKIVVHEGLDEEGVAAPQISDGPLIDVVSKADLMNEAARVEAAARGWTTVSSVTGAGLEELRRAVVSRLTLREEWRDPPAITNVRHVKKLNEALERIDSAIDALAGLATEEVVLAELHDARESLETITAERSAEDVLAHIFSRFCIGK